MDKILQAASNGAPWNVELEDKSETDPEGKKRTILERGLRERDHAHYKTTGGKAWIEDGELLVETDAFHAFRKAQKPADAAAPASPIPSQGKGF